MGTCINSDYLKRDLCASRLRMRKFYRMSILGLCSLLLSAVVAIACLEVSTNYFPTGEKRLTNIRRIQNRIIDSQPRMLDDSGWFEFVKEDGELLDLLWPKWSVGRIGFKPTSWPKTVDELELCAYHFNSKIEIDGLTAHALIVERLDFIGDSKNRFALDESLASLWLKRSENSGMWEVFSRLEAPR